MPKALFVYDVDQIWIQKLIRRFEPEGWFTGAFSELTEMIEAVAKKRSSAIVVNPAVPGCRQVVEALKHNPWPIFACVGSSTDQQVADAYGMGIDMVLSKNGNMEEWAHIVRVLDSKD